MKFKTRDVVEKIQEYLGDCTQKVICRYIGVTTVALSQNIDEDFSPTPRNKVDRRLNSLLYILECAQNDGTLEPTILHRLLTLPAYPIKDGWDLDVITGIHQDANEEMLFEIFLKSINSIRKPLEKQPFEKGLYRAIHS